MRIGKFKIRNLIFLLLCLVYIVHARWFYVLDISLNRKRAIAIISIVSLLFCIQFIKKRDFKLVNKIVIPFLFLFFIQMIISLIRYNQSLAVTYDIASDYIVILILYPLVWFAKDKHSLEKIKKMIIVIGIIVGGILALQTLVFEPMGIKLINLGYGQRLGGLRYVNSSEPIMVSALFSLSYLIGQKCKFKERVLYVVSILVACIELFLVSKTKGVLVIFLVTAVIIIWFNHAENDKHIVVKRAISAITIITGMVWLFNTKLVSFYYQEYNELQNTQYDTVSIRFDELDHAIKTLTNSPIDTVFGTGFISSENSKYSYIVNGVSSGSFSRTDIGVIGFIHEFGILGAIWLLSILIYSTRVLFLCYKKQKNALDYVAMYVIFVLGMGTLFLFNGERLPYFPLFLLLVVFYGKEVSQQKDTLIIS